MTQPAGNYVPTNQPTRPARPTQPNLSQVSNNINNPLPPPPPNRAARRAADQNTTRAEHEQGVGRKVLLVIGASGLVVGGFAMGASGLVWIAGGAAAAGVVIGIVKLRQKLGLRGGRGLGGGRLSGLLRRGSRLGRMPNLTGRGLGLGRGRGLGRGLGLGGGLGRGGPRSGLLGRAAAAHNSSRTRGLSPRKLGASMRNGGRHGWPSSRRSGARMPQMPRGRTPRSPYSPHSQLLATTARRRGKNPTVASAFRHKARNHIYSGKVWRAAGSLAAAGLVGAVKGLSYPARWAGKGGWVATSYVVRNGVVRPVKAVGKAAGRKVWKGTRAAAARIARYSGAKWAWARLAAVPLARGALVRLRGRGRVVALLLGSWWRRFNPVQLAAMVRAAIRRAGQQMGVAAAPITAVSTPLLPTPLPPLPRLVVPGTQFDPASPWNGPEFDTAADDDFGVPAASPVDRPLTVPAEFSNPASTRGVSTVSEAAKYVPHPHQLQLIEAAKALFGNIPDSVPAQMAHLVALQKMFGSCAGAVEQGRAFYIGNYPFTVAFFDKMREPKHGLIISGEAAKEALTAYINANPTDVARNTNPRVNEQFYNVAADRVQGVNMAPYRQKFLEAFISVFHYRPNGAPDWRDYLQGLFPTFVQVAKTMEIGAGMPFPGTGGAVRSYFLRMASGTTIVARSSVEVARTFCLTAADELAKHDNRRAGEHLTNVPG